MARQKGIIKLEGTLDGLNFYNQLGMSRVRENGSEFKTCMTSVKYFKLGLQPISYQFKDTLLHQRLVQLFTRIKVFDSVSERGQRTVGIGLQSAAGKKLLHRYVLTSGDGLDSVLRQGFEADWQLNGFRIAAFDMAAVRFPKATATAPLELGVSALPVDAGTKVMVVYLQFMQEVNGFMYPMKELNTRVFEVVYVD